MAQQQKQTINVIYKDKMFRASFRNNLTEEENVKILLGFLETQETIEKLFGTIHDF
jgi:ABC-type polysaccharide/polyol phosphate transport system ATPase subunit